MRLILLAGYNNTPPEDCPWLVTANGLCRLELAVREAFHHTTEPIVVLGADSADHALRQCRSLEKCELIFDTNGPEVSIISNLRAGMMVGPDAALVLPAEFSWPNEDRIHRLKYSLLQLGSSKETHIVQDVDSRGGIHVYGFPIAVTLAGRRQILALKDLKSLSDPRLVYKMLSSDRFEKGTSP